MRMKKNAAIMLSICLLLSSFSPISVHAVQTTEIEYAHIVSLNPYEGVNWGGYGQYKASMHTHTISSSNNLNITSATLANFYDQGYAVVAMTDHDFMSSSWERSLAGAGPTPAQITNYRNGVGRNGMGMIGIQYTNENSKGDHVNTFFANYNVANIGNSGTGFQRMESAINETQRLGGLSHINHPGRYTGAYTHVLNGSIEAGRNASANASSSYISLFNKYSAGSLVGMEIINSLDYESAADRFLWDSILTKTMAQDIKRPLWGFSNDDSHFVNSNGYAYNVLLMPSLSEPNIKNAMKNGAFYAVSRVSRADNINKNVPQDGDASTLYLLNQSVPGITGVNIEGGVITISGANYSTIEWIADGVVIATGNSITLNDHAGKINGYVRAQLKSATGIAFLQPFGIEKIHVCKKDAGTVTKEATCTEEGEMTYNCVVCKEKLSTEPIAKADKHVEDSGTVTKEPTCAEKGLIAFKCTLCEKVLRIDDIGKTDNHVENSGVVTKNPTCAEEGVKTFSCTLCGDTLRIESIGRTGHTEAADYKAATCTQAGYDGITCSVCKAVLKAVIIPATGHTEAADYKAATCTQAGHDRITCSVCNESLKNITIPAKGHTEVADYKAATCTQAGHDRVTCSVCNESLKNITIPAAGHKEVADFKAATCTEEGYDRITCSVCNESSKNITLPAAGHTEAADFKAATCTEEGYDGITCSVCKTVLKGLILPATGHTEVADYKAATCTEAGHDRITCSVCTESLKNITIPAKGHTEVAAYKAPTCTVDGSRVVSCSVCKEIIDSELIPATGCAEDKGTLMKAATCKEEGLRNFNCIACDEFVRFEVLPKTEIHFEDGGSVSKEATCEEDGLKEYKCTICGVVTNSEPIPAGHKFRFDKAAAATCVKDGYDLYVCVCGDEKRKNVIDAFGHSYAWAVSKEATCLEDGLREYKCVTCGDVSDSEAIESGHSFEFRETVDAACERGGYTLYACSCGEEDYRNATEALGHTCTWVTVKEATFEEEGLREYVCTVCGKVTDEEAFPFVHSEHDFVFKKTVDAACDEDGYDIYACRCGAEEIRNESKAPGHSYAWVTVTEPTCLIDGMTEYKCIVCERIDDVGSIPAAHTAGERTIEREAAVDEDGLWVIYCTKCGVPLESGAIKYLDPPYFSEKPDRINSTKDDVLFKIESLNINDLISISLNGIEFTRSQASLYYEDYDGVAGMIKSGSVEITLLGSFIKWLGDDEYKLEVVYEQRGEGRSTVSTSFVIDILTPISATAAAVVDKKAKTLTITVVEKYSDGRTEVYSEVFKASEDSKKTYRVGEYAVYVKLDDYKVKDCYIAAPPKPAAPGSGVVSSTKGKVTVSAYLSDDGKRIFITVIDKDGVQTEGAFDLKKTNGEVTFKIGKKKVEVKLKNGVIVKVYLD